MHHTVFRATLHANLAEMEFLVGRLLHRPRLCMRHAPTTYLTYLGHHVMQRYEERAD